MKRKNMISITALSTLALGVLGIGSLLSNRTSETKETLASRETAFTGVYRKVTSASELTPGSKVLLSSEYIDVLSDIGGNPGYLFSTRKNANGSSNRDFIYANNAYVVELTVYEGSITNSIALGGYYRMGWGSEGEHFGYIGYDARGSSSSNPGSIDYKNVGIGYYKDGTGIKMNIDDDTSYTVSFTDGCINLENVGGHGNLRFTTYYDDRFVFGGGTNINLYKQVELSNITVHTEPTKSASNDYHYKRGEKIDLSGLEIDARFSDEIDPYSFLYDDDPSFFDHDEYAVGTGTVSATFTFLGDRSATFDIIVDQNEQNYIHVNDDLGDYRGNCIVAANPFGDLVALGYKMTNGVPEYKNAYVNNDVITIDTESGQNNTWFELVRINGLYHLAKTLGDDSVKYVGQVDGEAKLENSATNSNALEAEYDSNNHCVYLKLYQTSNYLMFDGSVFRFANNNEGRAQLYKQELTNEEYESINDFVEGFHNATKVCVADGNSLNIETSTWEAQASAFNALTSGAQSVIAGATYTHNQEAYGSLKDIVDRYDYMISKYVQFTDFMSRKNTSAYHNNYQASSTLGVFSSNNSVMLVVAIVSCLSISLFGLGFFLKKKHR